MKYVTLEIRTIACRARAPPLDRAGRDTDHDVPRSVLSPEFEERSRREREEQEDEQEEERQKARSDSDEHDDDHHGATRATPSSSSRATTIGGLRRDAPRTVVVPAPRSYRALQIAFAESFPNESSSRRRDRLFVVERKRRVGEGDGEGSATTTIAVTPRSYDVRTMADGEVVSFRESPSRAAR